MSTFLIKSINENISEDILKAAKSNINRYLKESNNFRVQLNMLVHDSDLV